MIKSITMEEVRFVAFELVRKEISFDEPIPDFETRFPNILESCLATPFQKVFGHSQYTTLISKAGILFYLLIKNHPFQNGNKRIAITVLLTFLGRNKKWLRVDLKELYDFTMWVAASDAKNINFVLMAIEAFINRYIIRL